MMHLVEFGRGEAVYEMAAREALGNPLGVIQGGVATALADAAMAAATTTILTDEEEIREVLRQVAVYAGFPRAWNALATMKTSLERFDEPQDQESRP